MSVLPLVVLIQQLGLHPVTAGDLDALEVRTEEGSELRYQHASPKAEVGEYLTAGHAEEKLRAALGEPMSTLFGPGWWLFYFEDAPHCGFAVKASGSHVTVKEWTAGGSFRTWTVPEAEPLTTAFLSVLENAVAE